MPRACIIFHPQAALPDASAVQDLAWEIASKLTRRGMSLIVLDCGEGTAEWRASLAAKAFALGAELRHTAEFAGPSPLPLLPPSSAHRVGLDILRSLRGLDCDLALFAGNPAHAGASVDARRCGFALQTCPIALLAGISAEERSQLSGSFPDKGRDTMVEWALEARAVRHADLGAPIKGTSADGLAAELASLAGQRAPTPPASPRPRLSVCIPFFRQATYLDEALNALLRQTRKPDEVIIVDDGSPEPEALAEVRTRHAAQGWLWLRQANAGPAAARNLAAEKATGDLLVFCDADNLPRPTMLATLEEALLRQGADAVTCAFETFRKLGETFQPEYLLCPVPDCPELALLENCLGDTNMIVRRDCFLSLGGFRTTNRSASEDWEFLLRLTSAGKRLACVPEPLMDYRLTDQSHSHKITEREGAAAALESALAPLPSAWRRLWPHATGMLRNPSLSQQQAALEQRRAQLEQDRAALLTGERAALERAAALAANIARLESEIAIATTQIAKLGETLAVKEAALCALETEISDITLHQRQTLDKVESLTKALEGSRADTAAVARQLEEECGRSKVLEQELATLRAQNAALQAEVTRVAAALVQAEELHAQSNRAHSETLETLSTAHSEALETLRITQLRDTANLKRLEELSSEQARTEATLATREAALVEAQRELLRLKEQASASALRISDDEETINELRHRVTGLLEQGADQRDRFRKHEQAWLADTSKLEQQLAALTARLKSTEAELDARRDKIRRMETSASWMLTSPLRFLRRLTLDRLPRKTPTRSTPAALPTPTPRPPSLTPTSQKANDAAETEITTNATSMVDQKDLAARGEQPTSTRTHNPPVFRSHIDAPRSWRSSGDIITVRGWCFSEDNAKWQALRARIGGRLHTGACGLPRPDLALSFPDFPASLHAGFQVDIRIHPEDTSLALEVQDSQGEWSEFLRRPLNASEPGAAGSYEHWISAFDTPAEATLNELRESAAKWPRRPRISVLMPVYNTPEKWLRRAIDSVRRQTYGEWELCIADDASPLAHVSAVLAELSANDPRIRVVRLPSNGHICAATNAALSLATGELCALLDHDDELAPHALHCMAVEFLTYPQTQLAYSDEDKITEQGDRFDPNFKPDWNPDLLRSQNYVCHLAVLRTETLRKIGGLRPGLEGSQDWDLFLRLSEILPSHAIRHVPRVLYHWRAITGSTALATGEKDYISSSARRALEEHFSRLGVRATLDRTCGGHWHVRWPLPSPEPLVSIIIPTRNAHRLVLQCINSIQARTTYSNREILLVDNGSDDPEALACWQHLATESGVRVLRYEKPFNYSAINNFAAAHARGSLLCLLNNDIEIISPDWLGELASQALRPEVGAVGARLYYPDSRVQHAGVITGLGGVAGHAFKHFTRAEPGMQFRPHLTQNLSAVTAACLVVRKAVFEEVGGLDQKRLAIAFNDVDLCLRIQARGYRNVYAAAAELFHHESASRGSEDSPEKIRRFQGEIAVMKETWGESLLADPAYNPNLSLDSEDFALAYPPRVPLLGSLAQLPVRTP